MGIITEPPRGFGNICLGHITCIGLDIYTISTIYIGQQRVCRKIGTGLIQVYANRQGQPSICNKIYIGISAQINNRREIQVKVKGD